MIAYYSSRTFISHISFLLDNWLSLTLAETYIFFLGDISERVLYNNCSFLSKARVMPLFLFLVLLYGENLFTWSPSAYFLLLRGA